MKGAIDPAARYVIVDEIASGGMGTVFLALQTDEDGKQKPVAIKKLHAHLAEDSSTVDAFVDEARIAFRLRHPNVVRVHDVVPIDGQLVIVMDWVEGIALRTIAKSREVAGAEKLPIKVIRRILHDALEGLHAAHELKDDRGHSLDLIHRDISPQNLLVGTDGLARVTDFGIALAKGRLAPTTVQGGVKGKIPYLSPEQVNRSKIDRRSDIFAAGVVAWELLAGKRLFVAPSEGEIMAMILREPLQPPSAIRMDVPLDLDETILKALERKADKRFATAADFARAIADGGPMATHEEVGRLVATTAGSSLAARRQKLALAAERKAAARPLEEEMTATFIQPVAPTASVRPSRVVIEPVSIPSAPVPVVDPTGLSTALPSLPPSVVSGRSTTPLLIAVVLALGLAIVVVMKYTGKSEKPQMQATTSFPVAPVIPPAEQRGSNETVPVGTPAPLPVPPPPASTTVVELAPTPGTTRVKGIRPHARRDAGAPRAGQPFMPDDL